MDVPGTPIGVRSRRSPFPERTEIKFWECGKIKRMDSQVLFLAVILPGLFGISLVIEGVWKVKHDRSGVVELILGNLFLVLAVVAYRVVLR